MAFHIKLLVSEMQCDTMYKHSRKEFANAEKSLHIRTSFILYNPLDTCAVLTLCKCMFAKL